MKLPPYTSIFRYYGGLYIGDATENNMPDGFGFFSIPQKDGYSSIWYIGNFKFGQEHGFGTMFYPEHGVSYTGIYSQGEVQCDTTLSSAEINLHLQTHLIHVSNILNNVQEDLDDAKTTIEQVNCSLTNWKTKFDIVCNLAQSSGVDLETLNNIRNEHDTLTLYNKDLTSNVNYITTFTNIKKESESGY
eukprot:CAMPEP_0201689570 /NCGR_PEP_ID=MMETSP0578-20130828/3144_1 /ASSEMBLY_ACC=CAM_ASM_000663 /TAXON_ID=267565 /ORGANISM="Skeletonema grethea, Strain CCMP 1804" /LENGTH=188 /DNA_ID=CAMNT_0048174253 /DNA_START=223 /DNA_END=789 /DNA_ORIENTATION=+